MKTLLPEWYPQDAVLITWPHRYSDWKENLAEVESSFILLTLAITRVSKIIIIAYDKLHQMDIAKRLSFVGVQASQCIFHIAPTNDTWTRDYGPITIQTADKNLKLLDFSFNGWGEKFRADLDNQITQQLFHANVFKINLIERFDFVLEGGSIDTDGQGTLLTTSACLLSSKRNLGLSQADITEKLKQYFGAQKVIWLENGYLAGDDTDSHIDTLARFCNANTIAYVACDDSKDAHYTALKAMEAELQQANNAQGQAYHLIPLPWPSAKYDKEDGHRLPASYANFLIINGKLLLPLYEDEKDAQAIGILQQALPEYEVIGIPFLPIIYQHGSLHCLTMQLPQGTIL